MVYRYVPLLRSKAGEAIALHNLSPAAKQRMLPIVHLTAEVPGTFVGRLSNAWAGLPVAIDGLWNHSETGSVVPFSTVVVGLRNAGVPAIPSVEVGAANAYVARAGQLVAAAANLGVVVKARLGQVASLPAWLAGIGWQPASVDLVLQAGHVADFGAGVLDAVVAHALQAVSPTPWRSITMASSAAPKDNSTLPRGPRLVSRLDWLLWQAVHPLVPRQIDYGDYGTSHPDMTEPPGYGMSKATVSVRYALDNNWLNIKGHPTTGAHGQPMAVQYRAHAVAIRGHAGFAGLPVCWGDDEIQQIAAAGAGAPAGGRQTWVEIGMNRHLSLVAERLP